MDTLQYYILAKVFTKCYIGFKPCYKWIPFNTENEILSEEDDIIVLNLVINGYPSIQKIMF